MNKTSLEPKNTWTEIRDNVKEMKKAVQHDLLLRRYQKWSVGETPFEDKVIDHVAKAKVHVITSWRRFAKRTLDIVSSALGLIVLSPLMVIIAVAVKLTSKGPAIFKQTRVGKKGRCFTMYKFRSMTVDAEKGGPAWAQQNDPRTTSIGSFLRRSHLDELPQLFNVLRGDMSIVGPRPERPFFVKELRQVIPHYDRRLCTKPGITGLAQVRSGYDDKIEDVKKKVKYDIFYIQKMCPWLDLKMIFSTIGTVIFRTGR